MHIIVQHCGTTKLSSLQYRQGSEDGSTWAGAEMSHQSSETLSVYNTCSMHNKRSIMWRTNNSFRQILLFPTDNPVIASFKRGLYIWETIQPDLHNTSLVMLFFYVSPIMITQRDVLMVSTPARHRREPQSSYRCLRETRRRIHWGVICLPDYRWNNHAFPSSVIWMRERAGLSRTTWLCWWNGYSRTLFWGKGGSAHKRSRDALSIL